MRQFKGRAHHKMDAKGRVSLPAKYRTMLAASDLVLVPGTDGCLWLYTDEEYQKLIAPLLKNQFDEKYDLLRELFVAGAEDIEVDGSGRIRVPAEQREFASLLKEVTIAGKGTRLELWDSEIYKQRLGGIDRSKALKVLTEQEEQSN